MDTRFELLQRAEFAVLHYRLEFQQLCTVGPEVLMHLRRELKNASRFAWGFLCSTEQGQKFEALFEPVVSPDPIVRKNVQKPAPPFVIHPLAASHAELVPGDTVELKVLFWGDGIRQIEDFSRCLSAVGEAGIFRGRGAFDITQVESEDISGKRTVVWGPGKDFSQMALNLNSLPWWLDMQHSSPCVELRFRTPARLLSGGRPLFKPSFKSIFPFIFRRVSGMLSYYCGLEMFPDPKDVLYYASTAFEIDNKLLWEDWRTLQGRVKLQDLGGVVGSVVLSGDAIQEILWILQTGSLLNVGKGASYCGGNFSVHPA